jgi:hypothetical protein
MHEPHPLSLALLNKIHYIHVPLSSVLPNGAADSAISLTVVHTRLHET